MKKYLMLLMLLWAPMADAATVQLAWDYVQDPLQLADGFVVYRCTGTGCTNYAAISPAPISINILTYTDATAAQGMTYNWVVRAIGQGVVSDPSNVVTLTIPGKPAKPTNHRGTRQ